MEPLFLFYLLTIYGVCRRESIVIAWVKKKILSFWWMFMFCMSQNTKQAKKIPSACLSVCLAVPTWTFAVDTITFEGVRKVQKVRGGIRTHHTGQTSATLRDSSCSRNSKNYFSDVTFNYFISSFEVSIVFFRKGWYENSLMLGFFLPLDILRIKLRGNTSVNFLKNWFFWLKI